MQDWRRCFSTEDSIHKRVIVDVTGKSPGQQHMICVRRYSESYE